MFVAKVASLNYRTPIIGRSASAKMVCFDLQQANTRVALVLALLQYTYFLVFF